MSPLPPKLGRRADILRHITTDFKSPHSPTSYARSGISVQWTGVSKASSPLDFRLTSISNARPSPRLRSLRDGPSKEVDDDMRRNLYDTAILAPPGRVRRLGLLAAQVARIARADASRPSPESSNHALAGSGSCDTPSVRV